MNRVSAVVAPVLLAVAACSSTPAETSGTTTTSTTTETGTTTTGTGTTTTTGTDTTTTTSTGTTTTTSTGTTTTTSTTTTTGTGTGMGSSHGQGGITCSKTGVVSQDGMSYSYCVAKSGSVEMKIVEPPAGGTGPLRLALYLHGDGAGPYASHLDLRKLAPWAATQNVLLVAALAPNACAWWLKPSYVTCDATTPVPDSAVDTGGENAEALRGAIEALRAGWDIADSPVLFGGSSGGSIFLSASFLPRYGDRFPGAWALSCGGDAPWGGGLEWDGSDPGLVGANKLFFTYGDKDFVAPDVMQSISFYQGESIPTDVKVIAETVASGTTSHCGNVGGSYSYDQIGRVAEVWASYLVAE